MGQWTVNYLYDFQKAQLHNPTRGGSFVARYIQDHKRSNIMAYTINVDAAYNKTKMEFATAYAIFDPGGKIWAAGFRQIQAPESVMAAELRAIADGISFGKRNVPGKFKVFSDSVEAVHSVYTTIPYKGIEEQTISEIKNNIRDSQVTGIWYCQRNMNYMSHNLAKMSTKSPQPHDWLGDNICRHLCL